MLKDEYGKIVERYAFIRDITDEKEAEAEIKKHIAELEKRQKIIERYADQLASLNKKLQSSEMELRELNASKDKFFSIIAHDLRNPFQALIGMTNMLRTGYELFTEEELLEQIGVIESAAENTLQLIENLLQWARAQTGRIQFEPQEFELVVVAGENVYLIDEAAKQKNITVKNDVPDGLVTFADRNMVTTIIRNLITNAVKFTHKGGCITVSAAEKDGLIEVSVEDNGIGMEEDIKNGLFRIDKHQTTKGTENEKGTGLGLILCKEFVEKHGGNIWVESTKGKGSKFFFSLPVNNQAASNENLLHSVD
jgi:signal transduction histidine kinase